MPTTGRCCCAGRRTAASTSRSRTTRTSWAGPKNLTRTPSLSLGRPMCCLCRQVTLDTCFVTPKCTHPAHLHSSAPLRGSISAARKTASIAVVACAACQRSVVNTALQRLYEQLCIPAANEQAASLQFPTCLTGYACHGCRCSRDTSETCTASARAGAAAGETLACPGPQPQASEVPGRTAAGLRRPGQQ